MNSSCMACKALQKKQKTKPKPSMFLYLNTILETNSLFNQQLFVFPFEKKPVHTTSQQDPLDKADRSLHAGICFYYFQACL